jgi:type I restriction enzyme S subunit
MITTIEEIFAPLDDGRFLHQGWSPQCEQTPSLSEDVWGVLRTTAIQAGSFEPEHNKLLPANLVPRPLLEVKMGDLLITCAGPRVRCGVSCFVRTTRKRLMMSGKMYRFRMPEELVDPRYLEAYLQTSDARDAIDLMKTGGSDSGLNLTHERFKQLRIPLAPFAAQQCIVAEIEKQFTRLDAAVAALKRAQANLKRYRAAVLKAACEGRLVPTEAELARKEGRGYETGEQLLARILKERRAKWEAAQLAKMQASGKPPKNDEWKKKYKEPEPANTTKLPRLPEGWTWVSVGQVSWSIKDGPHYSPKYAEEGVPFITGGQVRPSGVDFEAAKFISSALHSELTKRCKPERGDILYTKGGTTGIARVNTYEIDFSVWVHVAVLKLVGSIVPFYLQHALNSPFCYGQSQRFTHGVGNQDLGLTRMVNIVFGLPPISEQRRIVEEIDRRLSALDVVGMDLERQVTRADRLRQSILKRAFEGKLVRQDSHDEPASVLLERIRAERGTESQRRGAKRKFAGTKTLKNLALLQVSGR